MPQNYTVHTHVACECADSSSNKKFWPRPCFGFGLGLDKNVSLRDYNYSP